MSNTPVLSAKQARFVQEYLIDGNGAQAALRAGYGAAGAKVTACRLTKDNRIKQAIAAARRAYADELAITRAHVHLCYAATSAEVCTELG